MQHRRGPPSHQPPQLPPRRTGARTGGIKCPRGSQGRNGAPALTAVALKEVWQASVTVCSTHKTAGASHPSTSSSPSQMADHCLQRSHGPSKRPTRLPGALSWLLQPWQNFGWPRYRSADPTRQHRDRSLSHQPPRLPPRRTGARTGGIVCPSGPQGRNGPCSDCSNPG